MFDLLPLSNSRSDHQYEVIFLISPLWHFSTSSDFNASEEIWVPILLGISSASFSPQLLVASLLRVHILQVIWVRPLLVSHASTFPIIPIISFFNIVKFLFLQTFVALLLISPTPVLSLALINLAFSFSAFSEVVAITFVCTFLSVSPGGSKYLSLLKCQLLSGSFPICFLISVSDQKMLKEWPDTFFFFF